MTNLWFWLNNKFTSMILIRYFLIFIISYLLIRIFVKFGQQVKSSGDKQKSVNKDEVPQKKVSKEIGDYIDYEEIKKMKK